MGLRPYQEEALSKIKENYDAGRFRQLASMATGTGKTVLFSHVPETIGRSGKWLVIAHRKELIHQAADKIAFWNPRLRVGIEMADSYADAGDDVVVSSVQSLSPERLAKFIPNDYAGVVVDEAHHAVAASYRQVFDHFGLLLPNNRRLLLGVTATPNRGDGQALNTIFDDQVYELSMFDAVKDGWLSDIRGIRVSTDVSLDDVKIVAGDFQQRALEKAVNTPARNKLVVDAWLEHAERRRTVGFTVDIQHAKDLAETFRAHGVRAEAIWGADKEREEKLARHRSGEIEVLLNAAVLVEGYDDWQIQCILHGKPTKSHLAYVQMTGRGTRLQDGITNLLEAIKAGVTLLKRDCLVIDVVDNTRKHSLASLPAVLGMNPKLNLKGKSVVAAKQQIDAAQGKHPAADLSRLDDIDKLDSVIEQVDLWAVKYSEEVLQESQLQWHKTPDGVYVLYVSPTEGVRVWGDLLDKWTTFLHVGETTLHEQNFKSRKEALKFAEKMLNLVDSKRARFLRREWTSGNEPATKPQMGMMRALGIPFSPTITKGQASQMINQYKTKTFTNVFNTAKEQGVTQ